MMCNVLATSCASNASIIQRPPLRACAVLAPRAGGQLRARAVLCSSRCLLCAYEDTAYQGSWLHEATTAGGVYDDSFFCRVSCLQFSRLRDPARHWLGCVTCETGNVLFKHFVQNETACEFTCSTGYTERRNADCVDGDCVPGVSAQRRVLYAYPERHKRPSRAAIRRRDKRHGRPSLALLSFSSWGGSQGRA